jgi:hypothetical protein
MGRESTEGRALARASFVPSSSKLGRSRRPCLNGPAVVCYFVSLYPADVKQSSFWDGLLTVPIGVSRLRKWTGQETSPQRVRSRCFTRFKDCVFLVVRNVRYR